MDFSQKAQGDLHYKTDTNENYHSDSSLISIFYDSFNIESALRLTFGQRSADMTECTGCTDFIGRSCPCLSISPSAPEEWQKSVSEKIKSVSVCMKRKELKLFIYSQKFWKLIKLTLNWNCINIAITTSNILVKHCLDIFLNYILNQCIYLLLFMLMLCYVILL